jgi:hypothetical protein
MRLGPWLKSILIASALLLSAASPNPSALPTAKQSESAAKSQQTATKDKTQNAPQACSPVTVIIKEVPSAQKPEHITAEIEHQPYKHWWQAPNASEWALFILTVPYVVVTICLFVVTLKAANAAADSAQTARLTLQSNRPLIIVSEIIMSVAGDRTFTPTVKFRNYGRNPAIVVDISLGLQSQFDSRNLKASDLRFHQIHTTHTQVVGINKCFSEVITQMTIDPGTLNDILARTKTLIAHGCLKYRDVFPAPEPYESHFCWFYLPPPDVPPPGIFYIGPRELNVAT